jgi:phosphate:Na+ symporter
LINLQIIFGVIPALILFIYGIEHFSREIQTLAGDKFRNLLGKLTKTPVRGAFLGAVVTSIIQSSSAVTVITVSLVNAGIISFSQSLGIIIGSNIGTTITAQLVAFKLTAFAPFFIIIGFVLTYVRGKYKLFGKPFFYFGLVFYALMLVSMTVEPIKDDPGITMAFAALSNIFIAIAVGIIFTAIVQSSSVTIGLAVVLAQSGLISLHQGIPLILGANIGTCATAFIASANLNLHAKRTSMANLVFKVGGVLFFLPFLLFFERFVEGIGGPVSQQIANAHLIFNVVTAVLFLLGVKYLVQVTKKIVPGDEDEILFSTKYLDRLPADTTESIGLIKKEITYSMEITLQIYEQSLLLMRKPTKEGFSKLEMLESLNDYLDERIEKAILEVSKRKLTRTEAEKVVLLVQASNAIEQLGDLGQDLGNVSNEHFEKGLEMPVESVEAVEKIYKQFNENLIALITTFPEITQEQFKELKDGEEEIIALVNRQYNEHLKRLCREDYEGTTFVESISIMETSVSKLREVRKHMEKYSKLVV